MADPKELDPRLLPYVRGVLRGEAQAAFEAELDTNPGLRAQLELLLGGATESSQGSAAPVGVAPGLADGDTAMSQARSAAAQADRQLVLGPLLGRGGMALIFSARQAHLGRDVAVKMLRPNAPQWVRGKLLEEARITGHLEHPGIVPVHDLVEDAQGELQVVLKRIDGEPWSAWMKRPDEVRARFEQDPLEWSVAVAISLCRAVQFAHERGVLHRDIKPANVMIGRFGEVSLLDWGVAGTLVRDPKGQLPCVHDVPFAGTLGMMAPEQVISSTTQLSPATDTYLLGASLFEAITGAAPHGGLSLEQRRAQPTRLPTFPRAGAAPAELLAIVSQALQPDARRRFASADALRKALEGFLKHRDAHRLAERASQRASEARSAFAAGAREAGEQAAAEADFGFRAALSLWPDDADTAAQREQLAADRVRFALEHGEAQAAQWMLGSLEAPPQTLVRQVDAAVLTEASERERLERIALEGDRHVGLRARRLLLASFGLVWLAFWGGVAVAPPSTALPLVQFLLGYTLTGVAVVLPQRKTMLEHRLNREMLLVYLGMLVGSIAVGAVSQAWGLPVPQVLALLMLVWAMGMGALAAIIEPASLVPALVWLGAGLSAARWPQAVQACLGLGTAIHVVWPLLVSLRLSWQARTAGPAAVRPPRQP